MQDILHLRQLLEPFRCVDEEHSRVFSPSRYSDLHNPSVKRIPVPSRRDSLQRELKILEIYESFNSGVLVCSRKNWKVTLAREIAPRRVWAN